MANIGDTKRLRRGRSQLACAVQDSRVRYHPAIARRLHCTWQIRCGPRELRGRVLMVRRKTEGSANPGH